MRTYLFFFSVIALWALNPDKHAGSRSITEFVASAHGFVRGQTDGHVDDFLGIPYAAPPMGELRWKAPVPPQAWTGIRDATAAGSECTQLVRKNGAQVVAGSEDCLYLNVYRPAEARMGELLPVLIFIHGGLNLRDSGNDYNPSFMVAKSGILVVTINYRLNVFGFLALPSLDHEAGNPASGNYGLLDQQAAMRWVHQNIRGFGGDADNVTIDSESAGAIDTCANLTSPSAAGLFNRAILESVYCPAAPHDEALETSAPVAAAAGCADPQTAAACLRAKPAAAVLQAAVPLNLIVGGATTIPGKGTGFNASPNFGNAVLPFKPIDALAKGRWNGSGVLIGSNHDEAALFVAPAMIGRVQLPLSERAYEGAVGLQFRSFAPAVLNEYPEQPDDLFLTYADEVTDDSPFGCAVSTLADSFSALTKTYRYQFDDETAPTPLGGWLANLSLGAYHGSELQFLFQMTKLPGPQTAAERRLSNQMIEYWTNFVKTGDPNGRGLVDWPRYDAYTHRVLSLKPDGNGVIDNFDTEHHCAFWATAPGRPF